jgi:hypothetical protein
MSSQPMRKSLSIGVLFVLAIMASIAALTAVRSNITDGRISVQAPTDALRSDDEEFDPIEHEEEAITLSEQRFPAHSNPRSPIARLVSRETLERWLFYTALSASEATAAEMTPEWGDVDPDSPVWLVAILGTGLTVKDVIAPPEGLDVSDSRAVDGAFYTWDANSGELMDEGGLVTGELHNYASIAALPTENISISEATQRPTWPPSTMGPTDTISPKDLTAAVPLYTEQAARWLTATPTP